MLPPQWQLRRRSGVAILEALPLARIPWLVHGFSTRVADAEGAHKDGRKTARNLEHASPEVGAYGFNLGYVEWDRRERVEENRHRLTAALDARRMDFLALRQFHSSMVRIFEQATAGRLKGDALATGQSGLLLTVQTADCVPILLVDSRRRVVAAIHAGWRGTLARIAQKTVGELQSQFGSKPCDLLAAIGPAIGGCCYEVGPEVAQQFSSQFPQAAGWFDGPFAALSTGDEPTPFLWLQFDPPGHDRPKRILLDLPAANRWQLEQAGIFSSRIHGCGQCTSCRNDWFFSYRREGQRTGRLMAAIGMK